MDAFSFLRYLVRRVRKALCDVSTKRSKINDLIPLKNLSKKVENTDTVSAKISYNFKSTRKKDICNKTNKPNTLHRHFNDSFLLKNSYFGKKKTSNTTFKAVFPSLTNDCYINTSYLKHSVCEPPTLLGPRSRSIMQQLEAYNCYPTTLNIFNYI
ncbi:hypothetical protein PMAC_000130 [Pneumocystis sp. 'macacae']|nr:hypothetical protein PMAC_000130 [Pneumocystis sp. 'macacae']